MIGPYGAILNVMGAKNTAMIVYKNEWWRLATPMLLHAGTFSLWLTCIPPTKTFIICPGVIHIGMNLILQLRVGVMLEAEWGKLRSLSYFFLL